MTASFETLWWVAIGAAGLMWMVRLIWIHWFLPGDDTLGPRSYDGPPADCPMLSVFVAAKDEANNIVECVQSMLNQDYPNFEVIVINDRSRDATPDLLATLAAKHPDRFTFINVDHLPDGWSGKNHAMHVGMQAAKGDWLVFTDADCRQISSRTLSLAMREALETKIDFLSLLPQLVTRTFWEHVLQPVCAAVMTVWFSPARVNNPRTTTAYANGAFMLMSRTTYDSIGGHEGVRTELNEDIQMARLAKAQGHRLKVMRNDNLYVARMYDSFHASWRGWSRIFYGSFKKPHRVLSAWAMLTGFSIFPWVSLLLLALIFLAKPALSAPLIIAATVVGILQLTMARFYQLARSGPGWSLTYALGASVCWAMLINALFKSFGATATTWRGTTYFNKRQAAPAPRSTGATTTGGDGDPSLLDVPEVPLPAEVTHYRSPSHLDTSPEASPIESL